MGTNALAFKVCSGKKTSALFRVKDAASLVPVKMSHFDLSDHISACSDKLCVQMMVFKCGLSSCWDFCSLFLIQYQILASSQRFLLQILWLLGWCYPLWQWWKTHMTLNYLFFCNLALWKSSFVPSNVVHLLADVFLLGVFGWNCPNCSETCHYQIMSLYFTHIYYIYFFWIIYKASNCGFIDICHIHLLVYWGFSNHLSEEKWA